MTKRNLTFLKSSDFLRRRDDKRREQRERRSFDISSSSIFFFLGSHHHRNSLDLVTLIAWFILVVYRSFYFAPVLSAILCERRQLQRWWRCSCCWTRSFFKCPTTRRDSHLFKSYFIRLHPWLSSVATTSALISDWICRLRKKNKKLSKEMIVTT